jgi:predicted transcriptional regulator
MEIVAQADYNWTLLAGGGRQYFSVLCGGVAMYAIEIELTAEEEAALGFSMPRAADDLADKVRRDEDAYLERHIPDFSTREEVRLAGLRWRKARRAEA